ncbi:Hmx1 protein [Maudiozyma humilis]|uniref:Hmx1 protein n=1 Tax=Maudiozyma humilis TaxID=51915 RepID=A0AAV5RY52_MAUHU|nr:Hmx1 protein [Kazachstania humilis]
MTSATIPSPTDVGALANRINLHTRDAHNKIDKAMSVNVAFALRHRFIYIDVLKTYYVVFSTIEAEIDTILATAPDSQTAAILRAFYVPEFRRAAPLLSDLRALHADTADLDGDWVSDRPALATFQQSIRQGIHDDPITVLAHCHVLYLALFAGGRVIRSTLYRNLGFLPNFDHLSKQEMIEQATGFFRFAATTDAENKLRWTYKRNYELATRDALTEQQKLRVLDAAERVFELNTAALQEIGQINRAELMTKPSFKLLTFLLEEWRWNDTVVSQKAKKNILAVLAFVQAVLLYYVAKWAIRMI